MSVKFTVQERVDPRDKNAPRKFYPVIKSSGDFNLKRISTRIAAMSTVNSADVLAVLDLLVQVMREEVADGNIIKLGEFGSFHLTLNGKGEEKAEDVTAANVLQANMRFRPGQELSNMLLTLRYEKDSLPPAA